MASHDSPKHQRGEGSPASQVTTKTAEAKAAERYNPAPYPIPGKRA